MTEKTISIVLINTKFQGNSRLTNVLFTCSKLCKNLINDATSDSDSDSDSNQIKINIDIDFDMDVLKKVLIVIYMTYGGKNNKIGSISELKYDHLILLDFFLIKKKYLNPIIDEIVEKVLETDDWLKFISKIPNDYKDSFIFQSIIDKISKNLHRNGIK